MISISRILGFNKPELLADPNNNHHYASIEPVWVVKREDQNIPMKVFVKLKRHIGIWVGKHLIGFVDHIWGSEDWITGRVPQSTIDRIPSGAEVSSLSKIKEDRFGSYSNEEGEEYYWIDKKDAIYFRSEQAAKDHINNFNKRLRDSLETELKEI